MLKCTHLNDDNGREKNPMGLAQSPEITTLSRQKAGLIHIYLYLPLGSLLAKKTKFSEKIDNMELWKLKVSEMKYTVNSQ